MTSPTGSDDVLDRGEAGAGGPTSGALPVSPLPTEFAQLADAILVAQQRIQAADLPDDVTAQLSRSVRRAVRTSRTDVARAHLALDRLHAEMDALGC